MMLTKVAKITHWYSNNGDISCFFHLSGYSSLMIIFTARNFENEV
jgi:hypothetical protein